jgi:hypothetical protein
MGRRCTELAIGNAHLGAGFNRHQPAAVEHAAGLDLPVGKLVHRLHELRGRIAPGARVFDEVHEAHEKNSF